MRNPSKKELQLEAVDYLRNILKPGNEVYTIMMSVNRMGTCRTFKVLALGPGMHGNAQEIRDITGSVSEAIGARLSKSTGGVMMQGVGMDMGFKIVYSLGRAMFPDGFGVFSDPYGPKKVRRLPLSASEAETMKKNGYVFCGRNGDDTGWEFSGGYAFVHRSL